MAFVRLPRPLLEEFITLWDQVQSISPTLPEQARHLIHRVDDKVAEIRSQASDTPTTGGDGVESQSTAADQPPQIPCLALQDETASSSDDQPATPLVRKRKRRVAQKITSSAQVIERNFTSIILLLLVRPCTHRFILKRTNNLGLHPPINTISTPPLPL
ncbi:hypothetical protein P5673_033712 [Acropora cervicornis]|uniref:Uncharacterized protein n=1 Tax=Acropora cervicornis TaxID=6130 RepID=A0AAD9UQX8_ACRCE|nr:hypothetical protein P5673_033712 [Acropora cervicornis]